MLTLPLYSGCGNTFALVNLDTTALQASAEWTQTACAASPLPLDGIIYYSRMRGQDWRMRIFNSDGSEAEMCGNGIRCLAQHLLSENPGLDAAEIHTLAGQRHVHFLPLGVAVDMGVPREVEWDIELQLSDSAITVHHMDTGVPHVLTEVSHLNAIDVDTVGRALRQHPRFQPRGANANFYQMRDHRSIAVRTYERGCERETLACGTGATAAALVAAARHSLRSPVFVHLASGECLMIQFKRQGATFTQVLMVGSAQRLAEPLQLMPGSGQKMLP